MKTPTDAIREQESNHPDDVVERAVALAEADEQWTVGKAPRGIAAAAMHVAYKIERPLAEPGDGMPTQMDLADEYGTTAVTLRKRYPHLRDLAEQEVE